MSFAPLMRKDLVLLARRRWWFFARGGIMLLLAIMGIWQLMRVIERMSYGAPPTYLAREAFGVFTMTLMVLIGLAAPGFGTGSLEEARATGTLDLLRLASISRMRLALVKLLAASAWPALIALSLAPFLALWSLYGGTTGITLVASVLLIGITGILLAAMGLFSRALVSNSNGAMGLAYTLGLAYTIGWPVFLFMIDVPDDGVGALSTTAALIMIQDGGSSGDLWWVSFIFAAIGIVTCGLGAGIALVFRDSRIRSRIEERTAAPAHVMRPSRAVWNGALLWREIRTGGGKGRAWMTRIGWGLSLFCLFLSLILDDKDSEMITFLIAFPVIPGLMLGVLSAATVASEKENGTLGPLLLAPHGPQRIVLTKFLGVIGRCAPAFLFPLAYFPLIADQIGGKNDLLFMAALIPTTFMFGSFGLLCSVLFRRTAVAVAATFIGSFLQLFLMGWLVDELPGMGSRAELYTFVFLVFAAQVVWVIAAASTMESFARKAV